MANNSKNILYAKLQTKDNHYIYDTYSNEILQVSKVLWDIIDDYLEDPENKTEIFNKHGYTKEEVLEAIKEIEEGRDNGYLHPCNIKKMHFYDTHKQMIEDIKHKIQQLTLEATQNCNFRCKYCVYSGAYHNQRTHNKQDMDWETALNAIKIFMDNSSKAERKNISFYGGEPLLKFDLIKKVVNYVKKHYSDDHINYSFTTNASLLNDDNIDFFINNKFNLLISLNGPKDVNDKYRIDIEGNGTFDRIIQALNKIIRKDQEYYNRSINFSSVLTPQTNYADVISFFSENKLFKNKNISFSGVDRFQTSFFEKYGDYSLEQSNYLSRNYFETAINNLLDKKRIISGIKEKSILRIYNRCNHKLGERVAPNGCCVPLLKKMYVDVNGNIHTCERVPLHNPLGNVNKNGIDFDLIVSFVEAYTKNSLKDCKHCWAVRLCHACYKYFMKNNKWLDSERKSSCKNIQNGLLKDFILYLAIIEKNPNAFEYMKNITVSI